jgi:hypothetical protein
MLPREWALQKNYLRFKQNLTVRVFRRELLQGEHRDFSPEATIEAGEDSMGAMKFDNLFAPGGLMEAVHILSNHGAEQSHIFSNTNPR